MMTETGRKSGFRQLKLHAPHNYHSKHEHHVPFSALHNDIESGLVPRLRPGRTS